MSNPNLHLATRGPRKPVASKAHFQAAFSKLMNDMGVQIVHDGRAHKSKEDFWKLYRTIKLFESAITAAAGRISLAGIGRFQMNMAGRGAEPRPVFRFYQSSFQDKFFSENKEKINTGRETDAAVIEAKAFELYNALLAQADKGTEGAEVEADEDETDNMEV